MDKQKELEKVREFLKLRADEIYESGEGIAFVSSPKSHETLVFASGGIRKWRVAGRLIQFALLLLTH